MLHEPNPDEVNLKKALGHYYQVMEDKKLSYVKSASIIPVKYSSDFDEQWREHENIRSQFKDKYSELTFQSSRPSYSFLDLKIDLTRKIMEKCTLCEWHCKVNRFQERGKCQVLNPHIASEFLHMGEERPLVPSHTIFFTGCNFQCVYCQNWDISQKPDDGMILDPKRLASIIDRRRLEGSRNVNFVGGDPTPNLLYILQTLSQTEENVPVIWNSNFYLSLDGLKLLEGIIDLYLTDFKYGNNECAQRLSGVPDYWNILKRNHKLASNTGDMIIRHLVLPGHIDCCSKPILVWIYENLGEKVVINIMGQYRPVFEACKYADISRPLVISELKEIKEYAEDLGFKNII